MSKRNRLVTIILLLVFAGSAKAQSGMVLAVRSGEHPTFSRLVFEYPGTVTWQVDTTGNTHTVLFSSDFTTMDLSRVYQRIPKTRLLSIRKISDRKDEVFLKTAADHHVEVFEIKPGKLVLDIKEGPPIPQASGNIAMVGPGGKTDNGIGPGPPVAVTDLTPPQPAPTALDFVLQPPSQHPGAGVQSAGIRSRPVSLTTRQFIPTFAQAVPDLPDARVLDAQAKLLEQLGRAMTQGVVTPKYPTGMRSAQSYLPANQSATAARNVDQAQTQTATAGYQAPLAATPQPSVGDPDEYLNHVNLDAQTVFDRDQASPVNSANVSFDGVMCIDDARLNLADWAKSQPVAGQIADLRRNLTGEFDKPDAKTLEALVKLYIAKGFGTEAKALLLSFDGLIENTDLLTEMAELIETGHLENGHVLARQALCPGASSMWAILSRPAIPTGEIPDGKLLNRHFEDLPAGIRRRLGPVLATRLLDAGFAAEAQDIAKRIARAPGEQSAEFTLLSARLDLLDGNTARAETKLREIAQKTAPGTDKALLLLMNTLLARNADISQQLIAITAARAFELRRSPLGQDLRRVEILAWVNEGDQRQAFEILVHESELGMIDAEMVDSVVIEIFNSFDLDDSDIGEFVKIVFKYRDYLKIDKTMDNARLSVARAMLRAGLPATATDVLAPMIERPTSQFNTLMAEIFLVQSQPLQALDWLARGPPDAAKDLWIRAYAQLGTFDRAIDQGGFDPESELGADIVWRAARWDLVTRTGGETRRQAARYVLTHQPGAAPPDSGSAAAKGKRTDFETRLTPPADLSIANLELMVAQSRAARATLEQLLKDHPAP